MFLSDMFENKVFNLNSKEIIIILLLSGNKLNSYTF
jgi:hypothetical protein